MIPNLKICLLLAFGVLLSAGSLRGQNAPPIPPQWPQMPAPTTSTAPDDPDPNRARIMREMQKRANEDRQAELKKDTEQLLKLATELKAYVDKTNENVLSIDVVKKAEQIEKLAHNVKDKMKGPN